MTKRIDLHGIVGGQRKTGLGRAAPIKVKPGVTTPYSAEMNIPKTANLQRAIVVIYISPDGSSAKKTFNTEVAVDVSK